MDLNLLVSERPENETFRINIQKTQSSQKSKKISHPKAFLPKLEQTKSEIESQLGLTDYQWKKESEDLVRNVMEKHKRILELKFPKCDNEKCFQLQEENNDLKLMLSKLKCALKIAKIEISNALNVPNSIFHEEKECQTREFILKERIDQQRLEIENLKSEKYRTQELHRNEIQKLRVLVDELKCQRTMKTQPNPKIQDNQLKDSQATISSLRLQLSDEKSKLNSANLKIQELEKEILNVKTKLSSITITANREENEKLQKKIVPSFYLEKTQH